MTGPAYTADPGYYPSPWPAEDGGPQRLQCSHASAALQLQPGETLRCISRSTTLSTMTMLGDPGQVYLLTHSALRANLGLPTSACVEQIDPLSLRTVKRSPRLAGGPMWPGGMAIHANGDLIVVYGRHAHRLNRDCELQCSRTLPIDQPYNSLVVLDNGLVVTKNLSDTTPAQLSVLDPHTLQDVAPRLHCPQPSIARLSARGNTVYVVGIATLYRYHWDDTQRRLVHDTAWRHDYLHAGNSPKEKPRSYAWDVVLADDQAWFMDNGHHRYRFQMRGAGVNPASNRLHRVSLHKSDDHAHIEISGLPHGSITNPPLIDTQRNIVLAYDSANAYLRAWRIVRAESGAVALQDLWSRQPFGCASHMLLYPDSGEVVINDYRRFQEEVVVLDIVTGHERGRVKVGGWSQGVVFPSVGWQRDFYWSSMSRLARVFVD